jgi:predicted Zn-dependent protease
VVDRQRVGFATVNNVDRIDEAIDDALTLARVSPADPHAGLPEAAPLPDFAMRLDPALDDVSMADLVDTAGLLIDRVKELDARVSIDSGRNVLHPRRPRGRLVEGSPPWSRADVRLGSLFGMAVDGGEVGSFDGESDTVATAAEFRTAMEAAARRFVTKCVGALHGGTGTSFKGTVILTPEAVGELVLPTLLGALSGRALRRTQPLRGKDGHGDRLPAPHRDGPRA